MSRIVFLQEYMPEYRVDFFNRLRIIAADYGLEIVVAAGEPNERQARRLDRRVIEGVKSIPQKEWRILGRRITVREVSELMQGADFLVIEQARRNLDAYRLLGTRYSNRKPVALWGHGRDYTHSPGRVSRVVYNWLTRKADWFFAYTDGGKAAVEGLGYPASRVTVVQNSIDTSALANATKSVTDSALAKFNELHDLKGKTALFLGGVDESKRIHFLLEASQRIAQMEPKFRLLIAGVGEDVELIKAALPYSPWLKYLGPIFAEDKALALRASQVLAMPGRVGLVAVDSFAAGIPIVTTNWQWHAPEVEYLHNGENSLVAEDSLDDYVGELSSLLNDQHRLAKLSKGSAQARDEYTLDEMCERFLKGLLRWQESPRA